MTELFNTLRDHKSNDSLMRDLGRHTQLQTLEIARDAYDAALTAVEAAVTGSAKAESMIDELVGTARAFKWADRNEPTRLFGGSEQLIGEQLAATIFGDRISAVQTYLAGETAISIDSAADVLQIVATVSIATAIGTPDENVDLASRLDSNASSDGAGPAAGGAAALPSPSYRGAAPQADGQNASPDSSDSSDTTAASAGGELQERQKRIALLTASVVAIAALFFVVGNGSDDEPTETLASTDSTETVDGEDGTVNPAVDDETPATEDASGEDQQEVADDPVADTTEGAEEPPATSIVTYNVPMVDIVTPDRPATGMLSFDFDTESGEVCYRVISTDIEGPYRTHIHVGGFNEKGGIVVDMGPQVNGATGCLDNPPADINNILADLENHYAELHDVSEEWTIRGQLSEAFAEGEVEHFELSFDPDSGGAYLAIENGILILRGEVPNLLTATTLNSIYAPAGSGIVISNELSVVPDAPVPSGRILLEGIEFPANSSDLPTIDSQTQNALITVLSAHDGWELTAVGRTDSDGSELNNLELSLRRAKSLRTYVEGLNTFDGSIFVRGAGDLGAQGRHLELEFLPAE